MPLPNELTPADRHMVSYLLGLLPENEAERLDEASVVDGEVASRLRGIEDDLIDAYVTETLDQNTRDHFEAFYLKSPRRREKVTFATRFLTVVDRVSAALRRLSPRLPEPSPGLPDPIGCDVLLPVLEPSAAEALISN
jgi:hypothetical protein